MRAKQSAFKSQLFQSLQAVCQETSQIDSPLKRAKYRRRLNLPTIIPREIAPFVDPIINHVCAVQAVMEDGEGDEAGEPEEHGEGVESEHGEWVGKGGEEAGGEGEVDEDEEGPDGDEEEEGVLGGGVVVGCDWRGRELLVGGSWEGRWGEGIGKTDHCR